MVVLKKAPDDKSFFLQDMPFHTIAVAKDVRELLVELKKAPSAVVAHHLRSGENDFANWIGGVLEEKNLETELKKIRLDKDLVLAKNQILNVLGKAVYSPFPEKDKKPFIEPRDTRKLLL